MLLLMYVLMRKQGATDWGDSQTPLKEIEQSEMHLHHIFPFNFMMTDPGGRAYAEREKLKPSEFRATVNDIANLTFLRSSTNARIGDDAPSDYLQGTTKDERRAHFIPEDRALWTPERFGQFLGVRAALIAKAATRLLRSLS